MQGLLVLLTPQAMTDPTETARQLAPFAQLDGQAGAGAAGWAAPACAPGRDVLGQAGIPTFDSPEAAIRAFLHMVQYRRNQELLYERPEALPEDWQPDAEQRPRRSSPRRARQGRTLLDRGRGEGAAGGLRHAGGAERRRAAPMEEAVQAAQAGRLPGGAEAAVARRSRTRATSAACS